MINFSPQGFYGLADLNETRRHCFNTSHQYRQTTEAADGNRFLNWMGHKALTVLSLPANAMGVGVGIAGMALTASTLGVAKIAIFAATLGNHKWTQPTGFIWCAERALHSGYHIALNLTELIYDAGHACYQGYRLCRWIGETLNLGHFFSEVFRHLGNLFHFVGKEVIFPTFHFIARRIEAGCHKAISSERAFSFSRETPSFIRPLNEWTKQTRIDWNSQERPLSAIFKHYVLSMVNIPVNALTATASAGASLILTSAFISKAALYAMTNIHVPLPTFAGPALNATYVTAINAGIDTAVNIGDGFVLLYKTSEVIKVYQVMVAALQVLWYIPEAIFS